MYDIILWKGEANRKVNAYRSCSCGCDDRGGRKGVGYISGSDDQGYGFTIWIRNESTFQALVKEFMGRSKRHFLIGGPVCRKFRSSRRKTS